jgi:factor associated with neutral sphingomyelinase activation
MTSSSIVKELMPQFYEEDDGFLVNKLNLNLGVRYTGELIEDVVLPKWANKDAKLFLKKMREGKTGVNLSARVRLRQCTPTRVD